MNTQGAAFFDVDGTIVHANIVRYYAYLRTCRMGTLQKALWIAQFLPRIPYYLILDKLNRQHFNRAFYRNYVTLSPGQLKSRSEAHFPNFMEPRIYPGAIARMLEHRRNGDLIVLVTGSLEPIVEPLARRLKPSEVIAARLEQRHGAFTGELEYGPLTDERKAQIVREVAARHNVPLSYCSAYADSVDDLPMLETVGHPAVVNPGRRLRGIAQRRGWEILEWRL